MMFSQRVLQAEPPEGFVPDKVTIVETHHQWYEVRLVKNVRWFSTIEYIALITVKPQEAHWKAIQLQEKYKLGVFA